MRTFQLQIDNDKPITFDVADLAQWNTEDQLRENLIEDLLTAPVGYSTIEGGGAQPVFKYTRIR